MPYTFLADKFFTALKAFINPLRSNLTKWLNTLKQFVGRCRRIV